MQIVKYKTGIFGLLPTGCIIECYLLVKENDGTRALLYSPPSRRELEGGCGVFFFARYNSKEQVWEDDPAENGYINQEKVNKSLLQLLKKECQSKVLAKAILP